MSLPRSRRLENLSQSEDSPSVEGAEVTDREVEESPSEEGAQKPYIVEEYFLVKDGRYTVRSESSRVKQPQTTVVKGSPTSMFRVYRLYLLGAQITYMTTPSSEVCGGGCEGPGKV